MQGIYTYFPETNYVPREHSVAAILLLLFMVLISLFSVLNVLYFYTSTFRSVCTVPNMAVFCSSLTSWFPGMLLTYFLNNFEIVPVAPIIYFIYYYNSIWMSLVTGLFCLVLLLNQRWSPPLRLQDSHCSTFRIMCDVPSIAVFCSESIERFPGTATKFFLKLHVTIPVAPIITGIIVHFRFHIRCISIHKLLYFNFFSASFIIIIIIIIITIIIYWIHSMYIHVYRVYKRSNTDNGMFSWAFILLDLLAEESSVAYI